ncbi:hypothetical protein A5865_001193, partial [Enterococcus sp. 12E11_DIV0728]
MFFLLAKKKSDIYVLLITYCLLFERTPNTSSQII